MNRRTARKLIREVQNELNSDNIVRQFWMDKVYGYVYAIFGDNKKSIAIPMFDTYYQDRPFTKWEDRAEKVQKLKELFEVYQKMIGNKVYYRRNILSDSDNGTLVAILITVVTSIGSIGYLEGQRAANFNDEYQLKKMQQVTDSFSAAKQSEAKYKHYYDSCQNVQPPVASKRDKKAKKK